MLVHVSMAYYLIAFSPNCCSSMFLTAYMKALVDYCNIGKYIFLFLGRDLKGPLFYHQV